MIKDYRQKKWIKHPTALGLKQLIQAEMNEETDQEVKMTEF